MSPLPFSLQPIAYSYCRFISHHFSFLRIDYFQIALLFVLLAGLAGIAFLASGQKRAAVDKYCPPWLYGLVLIAVLFLVRLPTFLPGALNPDEGMFLAGAMKLRHYPVFWRSLDGATSGPLNYYALTLLNLVGLPLDFATARLLNVLCIGGAIAVVYCIARLFIADWAARLAPLPALAAAMAFRGPDFLHYSSECVSVLLIAFATWLLFAESLSSHASWLRGVGIGLIAALLPLAKLQTAPIALVIAAAGIAQGFFGNQPQKWRGALYVSIGLAAGAAWLGFSLISFHVFRPFWQSYVVMNFLQANMYPPMSLPKFLGYCWSLDIKWYEVGIGAWLLYLFVSSYFPWTRRKSYQAAANQFLRAAVAGGLLCYAGVWWLSSTPGLTWRPVPSSLLVGLLTGVVWIGFRRRAILCTLSFSDVLAFSLLAASLYAVYRPHTSYPHYLLFLIFPFAVVAVRAFAWSLKPAADTGQIVRTAGLFVLFTLALPVFLRSKELRPAFESEAWMVGGRRHVRKCDACQVMTQFAQPGDLVTIWGWAPDLYVLTGTLPASREPQTPYQISMGGPLLGYFRERYMQDLQLHPPKVFVDAVGPKQFAYRDREKDGFETFPELRDYVTRNFYLAADVGGVRVFARRDVSNAKDATPEKTLQR